MSKSNPRWKTGKRRHYQKRFKAMQSRCALCGQPIDYSLPYNHPYAMVIDEKVPIKYWKEAGYNSPSACADDWNNIQVAHRRCNAIKGAKLNFSMRDLQKQMPKRKRISLDGEW